MTAIANIDFCASCRIRLDAALETEQKNNLYIVVNPEVAPPGGRSPIGLCNKCRELVSHHTGVDGFEVILDRKNL